MGSLRVQLICGALGVIGLIGLIVCCAVPRWKVSTYVGSNIITSQSVNEGLWMNCVVQSTGQQQCKSFESLLEVSSDLQATRAMVIISILVTGITLILFASTAFTTCVENEDAKAEISLVAGIGMIIAGLLVIIPVSWSAHSTISAINNPFMITYQKELGACIFIGWAAGALLILAGGLLCFFSRPKSGSGGTAKYYSNSSAPAAANNV